MLVTRKQIISIILTVILLVGLAVGIFLVQRQQIFKSKASQQLQNAFDIKPVDPQKSVSFDGDSYQTDTLDVQIRLQDIEALTR